MVTSSGINAPRSMSFFTDELKGRPLAISVRKICLDESRVKPSKVFKILAHWVVLPAPGAPRRMMRAGLASLIVLASVIYKMFEF